MSELSNLTRYMTAYAIWRNDPNNAENNITLDRIESGIEHRLAAHEMLVEALREIVEDVEFSKKHSDDLGRQNTLTFILDGARAALLKAEEL